MTWIHQYNDIGLALCADFFLFGINKNLQSILGATDRLNWVLNYAHITHESLASMFQVVRLGADRSVWNSARIDGHVTKMAVMCIS